MPHSTTRTVSDQQPGMKFILVDLMKDPDQLLVATWFSAPWYMGSYNLIQSEIVSYGVESNIRASSGSYTHLRQQVATPPLTPTLGRRTRGDRPGRCTASVLDYSCCGGALPNTRVLAVRMLFPRKASSSFAFSNQCRRETPGRL